MTEGARLTGNPASDGLAHVPRDVVAFIRFAHRRRGLRWPELYDEMCGIAARREFNGWDHADLASRGVTFSLYDMPRLAGWARDVLAHESASGRDVGQEASAPNASKPVLRPATA